MTLVRRLLAFVGLPLALAVEWTVIASWLFVWLGHLFAYYPWPWFTWLIYALGQSTGTWTKALLAMSALVASLATLLTALVIWRAWLPPRKLRRGWLETRAALWSVG